MRTLLAIVIGVVAWTGAAFAAGGDDCSVAAHLVTADAALPRVEAAIKAHNLTIVVTGTASSTLPGLNGNQIAFPARLETVLQKKLPGVTVKVIAYAKSRKTAAEMTEDFGRMVKDDKPALVVWQTGTADAIRGIDLDEFRSTLEDGIESLHKDNADVILMNMQYSPRTDSVIATGAYAEAIRFASVQRGINLFDRAAIMRHWSDLGTFDLYAATKSLDTAAKVHECIGRLLATLVIEGANAAETETKETR